MMSSLFRWFRSRPRTVKNRAGGHKKPTYQPHLEPLEDRAVPTVGFGSAFAIGGSGEWARAIAVDTAGSTYVGGMYNGTVDFNPNGATPVLLTSQSWPDPNSPTGYYLQQDSFVAKYNPDGTCAWACDLGVGAANGVAVDSTSGAALVTGFFKGTATFGAQTFTSQGPQDGYVARVDASGTIQWGIQIGGLYDFDQGNAVAVDASGNAYATGRFHLTDGSLNIKTNVFVVKLDTAGNTVWSKQIGGTSNDQGSGIAVDRAGNVVVAGNFSGSVDFDPGAGTSKLSSGGQYGAAFVLKLTGGGVFAWADAFQGSVKSSGTSQAHAVAVDSLNNVYVEGSFSGKVDFDPGKGTLNLPNASWAGDIYLVKLDAAGKLAWAKGMGGVGDDGWFCAGLAVDAHDYVYITGSFSGGTGTTATFGQFTLTTAWDEDVYVAKLDGNGNFLWAVSLGGTGVDRGQGIAVDGSGNVYITGLFSQTSDFDPDPLTTYYLAGGRSFVWKLTQSSW